jgi:hypothetical protein
MSGYAGQGGQAEAFGRSRQAFDRSADGLAGEAQ